MYGYSMRRMVTSHYPFVYQSRASYFPYPHFQNPTIHYGYQSAVQMNPVPLSPNHNYSTHYQNYPTQYQPKTYQTNQQINLGPSKKVALTNEIKKQNHHANKWYQYGYGITEGSGNFPDYYNSNY